MQYKSKSKCTEQAKQSAVELLTTKRREALTGPLLLSGNAVTLASELSDWSSWSADASCTSDFSHGGVAPDVTAPPATLPTANGNPAVVHAYQQRSYVGLWLKALVHSNA